MSALHVVFQVGDAEYALSADQVLQMDSFSGATPVPGAAAHVVGIVQVRGKVVPVVSLRARFQLPAIVPTIDSRIIVGHDGARPVALLVDKAREVVSLAESQVEPAPPMLAADSQGFVKGVVRIGSRMVLLIDFQRVVGEEQSHG